MRAENIKDFFWKSRDEDRLRKVTESILEVTAIKEPDAIDKDSVLFGEIDSPGKGRCDCVVVRKIFEYVIEKALLVVVR